MVEHPRPARAFQRARQRAVAAQVLEDIAVLRVREVRIEVGFDFVEPIQILAVAGERIGQHRRVNRLVLRPPELELVFVLVRLVTLRLVGVAEVENTAVLLVPAPFQRPVERLESLLHQLRIVPVFRLFQREPGGFDAVAGVDRASFRGFEEGAVGVDDFEQRLPVRVHEIAVYLPEAGLDGAVVQPGVPAEAAHENAGATDDHRNVVRLDLAGRVKFRRKQFRVVVVHHHGFVEFLGLRLPLFVSGGGEEFDVSHDDVVFRHHVAALADGAAVFGHLIIGAPVAVVEAVPVDERGAVEREREPLRALFDLIAGAGIEQHLAAELADVLVGVQHLAVASEIVEEAAVLRVRRMLLPERNEVVHQFVAVAVDVRLKFLSVHGNAFLFGGGHTPCRK
ncbi:hypothetical protein SDC9_120911 [bioreactor metagenome]|uniref:Uncharacterized protein n=1 Tax=bioreactor metagenome TaxID=1076179 RepID=A0A645CAG8_9ZZZZ